MKKSGLAYGNLFEYVTKKYQEQSSGNQKGGVKGDRTVSESELRDALRHLEEDGVVGLFGNNRNPTIRFIAEW